MLLRVRKPQHFPKACGFTSTKAHPKAHGPQVQCLSSPGRSGLFFWKSKSHVSISMTPNSLAMLFPCSLLKLWEPYRWIPQMFIFVLSFSSRLRFLTARDPGAERLESVCLRARGFSTLQNRMSFLYLLSSLSLLPAPCPHCDWAPGNLYEDCVSADLPFWEGPALSFLS